MTPAGLALAATMGEPAGIGGELTLMAWKNRHRAGPVFVAIDNAERLRTLAQSLALDVPIATVDSPAEAAACFAEVLPVIDIPLPARAEPGRPTPATAPAVLQSIDTAVRLALAGEASGVVTNPIQKHALYDAGFSHPGHTEYLAELCAAANPPVMMLASSTAKPGLRVVPVTIHVGLRHALELLTADLIVEQTRLTDAALRHDFAISGPRIVVAGLNPHAGEAGALGREEIDIITPAIETLKADGIDVTGPHPPDTLFSDARRRTYDAAICMYHDQALIPIKTLDFAGGVNITLGLSIVRTSPDHGTALEIAGTGKADPTSFLAALDAAAKLAANRHAGS